jgi:hypothetical protein
VDSSTGVNTGTDVITTDAAHGCRTGAEVRLTLDHKTNSVLPAPLVSGALITTTTPFAGAGTGAKYRLPKRYRKVTLREVDVDFMTSTTTTDAAIKIVGVQDGLLDRVTGQHGRRPDFTGDRRRQRTVWIEHAQSDDA